MSGKRLQNHDVPATLMPGRQADVENTTERRVFENTSRIRFINLSGLLTRAMVDLVHLDDKTLSKKRINSIYVSITYVYVTEFT